MIYFTLLDMLILLVVLGFGVRSFLRGFFREFFSLLALGCGVFVTLLLAPAARPYASSLLGEAGSLDLVFNLLFFFVAWMLVVLFFRVMFHFFSTPKPELLSRFGGGLVGCAKGVCLVAIVLLGIETYAPSYLPRSGRTDKVLPYMREVSDYIVSLRLLDVRDNLDFVKRTKRGGGGWTKDSLDDEK